MMNTNALLQKIALLVLEETGWKPPTGKPVAAKVVPTTASGKMRQAKADLLTPAGRSMAARVVSNGGAIGNRKEYIPVVGLSKALVAAQGDNNNGKVLHAVLKAGRRDGITAAKVAAVTKVNPKSVESSLYQLRTAHLIESRPAAQ